MYHRLMKIPVFCDLLIGVCAVRIDSGAFLYTRVDKLFQRFLIGVINHGELILVEETTRLMRMLGKKQLTLELHDPLSELPDRLAGFSLELANGGSELVFTYDTQAERTGITALLDELMDANIGFKDLHTTQSSLEEIFVDLVKRPT